MDSDKPIPPPKSCLGNLARAGLPALRQVVASASVAHGQFFGGIRQEEETVGQLEERLTGSRSQPRKPAFSNLAAGTFDRGDNVYDVERQKKGIIVRVLKAGAFEIVDRKGNAWKQRGDKLKLKT